MTVILGIGANDIAGASILYSNVFETGTVTASTSAVDGDALNATDQSTWDFWTPTAVPAWIKVDAGSAVELDGAGIAAHTLGTAGAVIKLQYSLDNVAWVDVATDTPVTDELIFIAFSRITARYWRFYITGAIASIGVVSVGSRLKFSHGVLSGHTGLNNAIQSELMSTETVSGQFGPSRVVRRGAETSLNFGLVDTSFGDGLFASFRVHYNDGGTFFYAGSPLRWPKDIGYCKRPDGGRSLNPAYVEAGQLMEIAFDVVAYVG